MEGLVERIAALEQQSGSCSGGGRDYRVILMHIARAEEKVLRMEHGYSWTQSASIGLLTGEL